MYVIIFVFLRLQYTCMNKFGAIWVSFIYLVFSIGLVVNLHYCHGEIEEIDLIVENTSCCTGTSCCSEPLEEHDKCCNEIQYFYQVVPDILKAEQFEFTAFLIETSFPEGQQINEQQPIASYILPDEYFDIPHGIQAEPFWVIYCSPTFYG